MCTISYRSSTNFYLSDANRRMRVQRCNDQLK